MTAAFFVGADDEGDGPDAALAAEVGAVGVVAVMPGIPLIAVVPGSPLIAVEAAAVPEVSVSEALVAAADPELDEVTVALAAAEAGWLEPAPAARPAALEKHWSAEIGYGDPMFVNWLL